MNIRHALLAALILGICVTSAVLTYTGAEPPFIIAGLLIGVAILPIVAGGLLLQSWQAERGGER